MGPGGEGGQEQDDPHTVENDETGQDIPGICLRFYVEIWFYKPFE